MPSIRPWVCPECFVELGSAATTQPEALTLLQRHRERGCRTVHADAGGGLADRTSLEACPLCGQGVSARRLASHLSRRCPKRASAAGNSPTSDLQGHAVAATQLSKATAAAGRDFMCVHGVAKRFCAWCQPARRIAAKRPRRARDLRETIAQMSRRETIHVGGWSPSDIPTPVDKNTQRKRVRRVTATKLVSGGLPSLGRRR